MNTTRRSFVKKVGLSTALLPLVPAPFTSFGTHKIVDDPLEVHIFSKHLQFLDYATTGAKAAEMGFAGVDLTVRPKGHVLPENVAVDLRRAVEAIEIAGSKCKMITTSIESVSNRWDVDIIKTSSTMGVEYYRTHWFKFLEGKTLPESIAFYQKEIEKLGDLNAELGIVGCYQNHAGTKVGASYWEVKQILETVNPKYFGTQYDIRHAIAEGGHSWVNGLQLLKDQVKVIVLKDFLWAKKNGRWKAVNVPIGEGMVDFDGYFKLLKKYGLKPPVSLHLEYPLGGAEKGKTEITVAKEVVYTAMKRDLNAVQKLWAKA